MSNKKSTLFKDEYKDFVKEYMFRLLGWSKETIALLNFEDIKSNSLINEYPIQYDKATQTILFSDNKVGIFKVYSVPEITEEDKRLSKEILLTFFQLSKYKKNNNTRINIESKIYSCVNYDYIIERGLYSWMVGSAKRGEGFKVEKLMHILKVWAEKTYEGHNVCFGILLNPKKSFEKNEYEVYGSFLDFLDSDYSAVLSDGISSIVEINEECELIGYHSITEKNKIQGCENIQNLPYRFASIINEYVIGEKVGIFLLVNGDIILAKNKSIYFVRRNSHWLNFKYESFFAALNSNIDTKLFDGCFLKEIFSSTMDVSLSHTGGIIAVIDENHLKDLDGIASKVDLLNEDLMSQEAVEQIKKQILNNKYKKIKCKIKDNLLVKVKEEAEKADLDKRLLKRGIILQLIKENGKKKNFTEIDRKLRNELIGLDGACIINKKGDVFSFGAIIENEPGSSGGGRGAAAKRLSELGGFAIKISTDGYIELYVDGNIIYSIK